MKQDCSSSGPGDQPSVPAPSSSNPAQSLHPLVLDTRPIFASGETPCDAIDNAVAALVPGQSLVLLVPFEPVPLYAKLGNKGYSHETSSLDDGTWRVEFRQSA
jgi:hypothetical protein